MSHSSIREFDFIITDLNGNMRGKRLPDSSLNKIFKEGIKLPRSVAGVDFWGEDVAANGLLFETGDNDGLCLPITDKAETCSWNNRQQVHGMMYEPNGEPFLVDPRQILANVVEQYQQQGLTAVVATELEFYLLDSDQFKQGIAKPGKTPGSHSDMNEMDGYSIDLLDQLDGFFSDIRNACVQMDIPADTIISEIGPGQFEINLNHQPDPLLAADHAIKFKRLVKGVARNHGFEACFMAKPFVGESGNGFHTHFSILDKDNNNIFDDGSDKGTDTLRYAVTGLLAAMPESMLIFAPNQNSYRRLMPGTHAPTLVCWGYDNRTTSVRIPESPCIARRIEHRVAGADANPYLVIATVLAAALHGIQQKQLPIPAIKGNAYEQEGDLVTLPNQWTQAIEAFSAGTILPEFLGEMLHPVYSSMKRQEHKKLAEKMTDVEMQAYLGRI